MEKAQTAAFEEYEKQKELKRKLEREIEAVRMSYIEYLEDYAPVYYKYMQEWDALCLKKDKAYIDLYGGNPLGAYNQTQEVLKEYPTNREALLLKGLSLIQMSTEVGRGALRSAGGDGHLLQGADQALAMADSVLAGVSVERTAPDERTELQMEAEATLDQYIKLYPSRSAPALVLKGLLYREQGEAAKAVSYFDQASMEYPRQAAALTDLLDSYKARTYLNKSAEGKSLLRLYRSTMEGFGIFSPNLLKAHYYAEHDDVEKSKEEIFNHFYRRGNQGVYDCLLSDMQYCEENMYSSFRQILMEQSFLDVAVEPTMNWTLSDKDDEIKVTINNRSDIDLENVRIFLCLHYTDMYKDEYDVQKLPSVNIIKHHDSTEIGVVKLNYEDKKYNDITRIRAIAMTDDKICWIDNVDYKYMRASEAAARGSNSKPSTQNSKPSSAKQQLLDDFNVDNGKLQSIIQEGMKVYGTVSDGNIWNDMKRDVKNLVTGKDKKLRIELPRILTLIDPVFSLYQLNDKDKAVRPSENYLSGSNIRLKFDYEPKQDETIPLYIYSDFANFKVTIKFEGGKPVVKKVELV
jgi:tetratricopeptide (TPR) repeat protein